MKIEDIRIGMKLYNSLAGRTGKVTKIEREGGLELVGNGLSWDEHVENVEPVSEFNIGDRVRMIGPSDLGFIDNMGQIGTIVRKYNDSFDITWDNMHGNTMPPTSIEHVSVCESCEMARVITSQCKQIASWKNLAIKNGDMLAELLEEEKPIHPAIHVEDFRPFAEVAKCYIQVEPERLFLSQDAKRVVEFLTATDTPVAFWRISEGMKDLVSGAAIIDGLIEAREAGIVRLDEGKYSIARE